MCQRNWIRRKLSKAAPRTGTASPHPLAQSDAGLVGDFYEVERVIPYVVSYGG